MRPSPHCPSIRSMASGQLHTIAQIGGSDQYLRITQSTAHRTYDYSTHRRQHTIAGAQFDSVFLVSNASRSAQAAFSVSIEVASAIGYGVRAKARDERCVRCGGVRNRAQFLVAWTHNTPVHRSSRTDRVFNDTRKVAPNGGHSQRQRARSLAKAQEMQCRTHTMQYYKAAIQTSTCL